MAGKRTSYAWAYGLPDEWSTDPQVNEGIRYARRLAEQARAHSKAALAGEGAPFPLTPADLAFEERISESTVRRKIALARRHLYGELSDSGIYYRRAKARALAEKPLRTCKAPDCEEPLPRKASRRREYCHPRCRRRHHYQRAHPETRLTPERRGARERPIAITPEQLEATVAYVLDHARDPALARRRVRAGKYRVRERATDPE